jgi:CRP-like cAMP-binding protein
MSSSPAHRIPFENRILSALPREEYERVTARAEPLRLPAGRVLCRAGEQLRHAYFPRGGMLSLLSVMEDGSSVEVGMVGHEGVVGIPAVLRVETMPYQVTVQLPGNVLRVGAAALREEFNRGGKLQDVVLRYMHTLLMQLSQSAACNRFHTLEQRLCRWLLISRDRARTDNFNLTQEFISQMMGAPRARVTIVAGNLQREGLISYTRGKVRIVDVRRLEATACECYRVVNEQISHFIAA